jgi:hypothetical protein
MLRSAPNASLADDMIPVPDEGKQESSSGHPLPVGHAHHAVVIDGVHTEILMDAFADCVFVLVTQTGKMGTTVRGTADAVVKFHTAPAFDIQPVLGRQNDVVTHLIARELLADIAKTTDKALLLSVALKKSPTKQAVNTDASYVSVDAANFQLVATVVSEVKKHKVWK